MKALILLLVLVPLTACKEKAGTPFTLYRNSIVLDNARIHWASFDADMPGSYNQDHCEQVRAYLAADPEVSRLRFWCEAGRAHNVRGMESGQ